MIHKIKVLAMIDKVQIVVLWCLLLNVTGLPLMAQRTTEAPVSYAIKAPKKVEAGNEFIISVIFNIKPGWFVYAPIEMNTALGKIPTEVSFKVSGSLKKIGDLELPDENIFFDTYRGDGIKMSQKFRAPKYIEAGKQIIELSIIYQTCNEDICYPPVRKKVDVGILID